MTEDVWSRIAKLRVKDVSLLAPSVRQAVTDGIAACQGQVVTVTIKPEVTEDVPLDPTVVETIRVQEMQEIYFSQGSSKQRSILKSMHCYGVAFDIISQQYGWFTDDRAIKKWPEKDVRLKVSLMWYRAVANKLMETKELAWGGLWKRFPDSPHFQSSRVPAVPNDIMITTYQKAGGGEAGRKAVWKLFKLT